MLFVPWSPGFTEHKQNSIPIPSANCSCRQSRAENLGLGCALRAPAAGLSCVCRGDRQSTQSQGCSPAWDREKWGEMGRNGGFPLPGGTKCRVWGMDVPQPCLSCTAAATGALEPAGSWHWNPAVTGLEMEQNIPNVPCWP